MRSKRIIWRLSKAIQDPLASALTKVVFALSPLTLLAKFLGDRSLLDIGVWAILGGFVIIICRVGEVALRKSEKLKKLMWLADDINELILFPYTGLLCLLILLNNGYDYMTWSWVVVVCAVMVVLTNHLPPPIARRVGRNTWLRPIDPLAKALSNASLATVPIAIIGYFIDNMWLLVGALIVGTGLFIVFLVRVTLLEQEGQTSRGRSCLADKINEFLLLPYNLFLCMLILRNNGVSSGWYWLWIFIPYTLALIIPARMVRKKISSRAGEHKSK